jgi:hypothetical protein
LRELHKHIALLVFGIFIFPILFQPVHIIWHHSHETPVCTSCHVSDIGKQCTDQKDENSIDNQEKQCLVCSYEFSITELPEFFIFECNTDTAEESAEETPISQPCKTVCKNKTSRAPPVLKA